MRVTAMVRAVITALALASFTGAALGCGDSPTAPSGCSSAEGPFTWDNNVARCRASNGQFAPSSCCGR